MKKSHIIAFLSIFSGVAAFSTFPLPAAATAQSSSIITTQPTKDQLSAKIAEVKSLENYEKFASVDPELLPYLTDFAAEYRYLFELVSTAESMLENYDTTSPANLNMIISAADDAIISCNLKFGITKREAEKNQSNTNHPNQTNTNGQNQTSANNQNQTTANNQKPTSTPITSSASTNKPATRIPIASAATSATPSTPAVIDSTPSSSKTSEQNKESTTIEVPATNAPKPQETEATTINGHPIAFALISTAGIGIILALIISSRKKAYRPGRKA